MTNVFEFRPIQSEDGREVTEMLYQVEYAIGLGPLGLLLNAVQEPGMRAAMRTSMTHLDRLIRSESSTTAR